METVKIAFLVFLLGVTSQLHSLANTHVPYTYYEELSKYCTLYGVPILYAARLFAWESGWNPVSHNKNPNGTWDSGLGQHNSVAYPDFVRWYNNGLPYDVFNWRVNMRISIQHLRRLCDLTGGWWSAIASYNMGLAAFRDWETGNRRLAPPTKNLLNYVMGY